jgi:hypothetical protein
MISTFFAVALIDIITAAAKYRNNHQNSEEKSSSPRNYNQMDAKNDPRDRGHSHDSRDRDWDRDDDQRARRNDSRDNSIDRDRTGNSGGSGHESQPMRRNNSKDFSGDSDTSPRGRDRDRDQIARKKSQADDSNSVGSNGSRGRGGTRVPNTATDHRKGGNANYPDASTAARMHSHISGEPDERVCEEISFLCCVVSVYCVLLSVCFEGYVQCSAVLCCVVFGVLKGMYCVLHFMFCLIFVLCKIITIIIFY